MTSQMTIATSNRQAPWIGVGAKGEWTDYRDALVAGDLDFYVIGQDAKTDMHDYLNGVTYPERVPGIQVNVRQDTQSIMGVVSSRYGIVQNEDAFSMLEPFTQAGGVITNAGHTEQGLMFMVLKLKDTTILGDAYDIDVMAVNSFNGEFPCSLIMVPMRIICQNMYRKLMGKSDNVLRFRHCSLVDERMRLLNKATTDVLSYTAAFRATLEQAASNKMTPDMSQRLVEALFPYPQPGGAREQMSMERVDAMREEFRDRYYDAPDNVKFHGTGMGFINAYMDYLSHRDPTKNMSGSWSDRRLSGLVSGQDVKGGIISKAIGHA